MFGLEINECKFYMMGDLCLIFLRIKESYVSFQMTGNVMFLSDQTFIFIILTVAIMDSRFATDHPGPDRTD